MAQQPAYQASPLVPGIRFGKAGLQETVFGAVAALAGTGFVAALGLGIALPAFSQKPVDLHLVIRPGQVQTFTLHQSTESSVTLPNGTVQPEKTDLTGTESLKWVSVDLKGVATVDETVTIIKETINGKPAPASATAASHQRLLVYPDGHVTPAVAAADPTAPGAGTTAFTIIEPTGRVRPGDTWTRTFDGPFVSGKNVSYTANGKFAGYKDVNGIHAAVVQTDFNSPLDVSAAAKALPEFASLGLPAGASIHFTGKATGHQAADLDIGGQRLLDSSETDNMTMTMTFLGLSGPTAAALAKGYKFTSKETTQLY
jgi:hypothetical protein